MRLFFLFLAFSVFGVIAESNQIVNDDYCDDLTAGLDESTTSACSGITIQPSFFYCTGSVYLKQRVPTSRVNDGVCDCCDGSDEMSTQCEDKCEILERVEKERLSRLALKRERGILYQQHAMEKAQSDINELRQAEAKFKSLGPQLDDTIRDARKALEEAKTLSDIILEDKIIEAGVTYKNSIKSLFGNVERETLQHLIAALTLRGREETGEVVLKVCEDKGLYELPGKDPDDTQVLLLAMETAEEDTDETLGFYHVHEGVAMAHPANAGRLYDVDRIYKAVRLHKDSLSLMSEALSLDRLKDLSLMMILEIALMEAQKRHVVALSFIDVDFHHIVTTDSEENDKNAAIVAAIHLTVHALPASPDQIKNDAKDAPLSPDAQYQQDLLDNTLAKKKELEATIKQSEIILKHDYGVEDHLYPLVNTCASHFHRGYTYRVCPFGQAKQDNTLVGNYHSHKTIISNKNAEPESVQWLYFSQGQYCHASRKAREMSVRLECSDEEQPRLSSVEEPEVCVYTAILHTHTACQTLVSKDGKDEL